MRPTVRVIIVTYNALESATRPCLESVLGASVRVPFALTVVDNASTDGTREFLLETQRTDPRLDVILNGENRGFAAANNQGLTAHSAPFYLLLNSDTVVDDGWLDGMIGVLDARPEVGMVGPVSNSVGNEQRIVCGGADERAIMAAGRAWAAACDNDVFLTELLGFFCVAIRQEVIERVGLLDEHFGVGFFEDDDYCARTLAAGFSLACHEGTFVLHKGGVSFDQLGSDEKNRIYYRNLEYFERKHGREWVSSVDVAPFLRVLNGYLDDLASGRSSVVAMKMQNRLDAMRRFDYAKKNLEGLRLWNACLDKDKTIAGLSAEIEKRGATIEEQRSRINALELASFIRRSLQDHARRLDVPFRIFGTGRFSEVATRNLGSLAAKLTGYFDNNEARWGVNDVGLPVSKPEYLHGVRVLVCSQYTDAIDEQLLALGYKSDDIVILSRASRYNPYDYVRLLKPLEVAVLDAEYPPTALPAPISVVITIKNEADGIDAFLASLAAQTRRPEQVVIVDGGSSDGTVERVTRFAARCDLKVELVEAGPVNVPKGRNIGIARAAHDVLVFLDAGCVLGERTLANLLGPMAAEDGPDLAGGVYDTIHPSVWGSYFIPNWEDEHTYSSFLPSSRLVAVTRRLLEKAGPYPEHLWSGEDTLFAIRCRRHSSRWAVNKRAKVYWDAPRDEGRAAKLWRWYGKGDGESGVGDFRYYANLVAGGDESSSLGLAGSAQFQGYLEGRGRRAQLEIDERAIEGVAVILSGVPINDVGGGQRGTQLAIEFIRRNYKVVFVNVYPSYEERVVPMFLETDYSLLELYGIDDFDASELLSRYSRVIGRSLMILEFPHPRFLPLVEAVKSKANGWSVVYDYLDNWDSSLGGSWHSPGVEQAIVDRSDALIASARSLRDLLATRTGRPVHLVPNAVNSAIFDPGVVHPVPSEYEVGRPVALYTGALYGEWFDWDVVEHALRELPDWQFVFIGNAGGSEMASRIRREHANALFLGPRPQLTLPQYLQHARACLIPFRATHDITRFVNPLKVYEYLAMRKPVVATDMDELRGIPGVCLARTPEAFVEGLRAAGLSGEAAWDPAEFVRANDWAARVDGLLAHLASVRGG
jgi:GT2 family glycosyltransferase/glycosyltransferase involved in cell wall biosynthesis